MLGEPSIHRHPYGWTAPLAFVSIAYAKPGLSSVSFSLPVNLPPEECLTFKEERLNTPSFVLIAYAIVFVRFWLGIGPVQ